MAKIKLFAAKYKFWWFTALMFATGIMWMLIGITLPRQVALVLLLLAVFSDMFLTYQCLRYTGKEGNPVVAFAMKKFSVWGTFMISACLWALYIKFKWTDSVPSVQTAIALTYWLVPLNNLLVLRKLKVARASTQEVV